MWETLMRNRFAFLSIVLVLAISIAELVYMAGLLPFIRWWFPQMLAITLVSMLGIGWALGHAVILFRFSR